MPNISDASAATLNSAETQGDEASLPFDLTVFVSQRLSVSMDEATRLLADWMRGKSRGGELDLYNH